MADHTGIEEEGRVMGLQTLPAKLASEIGRVSALRERYREIEERQLPSVNCAFVLFLLNSALTDAIAAAGNADIEAQMRAVKALEGFTE
jgi:hypothetical protein